MTAHKKKLRPFGIALVFLGAALMVSGCVAPRHAKVNYAQVTGSEGRANWAQSNDEEASLPPAPTKHVQLLVGQRDTKDLDFNETVPGVGPVQFDSSKQTVVGLQYAYMGEHGYGFEGGFSYWEGDDDVSVMGVSSSTDFSIFELNIGVQYAYRGFVHWLPYAGVGGSVLFVNVDENDGREFGAYVHGGLSFIFTNGFTIGVDIRTLSSATSSDDIGFDYTQVAATIGYAF